MKPSKTIYTLLLIGISFLIPIASFSQITSYKFEQLDSLQKAEKRNVAVFIHTNWCKYCHTMQNTTLKNDSIIEQLNKKFYFINLNAEQKKDIVFNGHTFKYKPTGINTGIHELAEQLATIDNKVAYPTICFLNANNEIIFQYDQFINSTDLDIILKRLK
jgi:thioredoxin-related protein